MKPKDTLSSCSDLDEEEIQQLQKQAKILKENSLNKLNALQTRIQHLSSSNYSVYYNFRDAFHRLFDADERTFTYVLFRNMLNLERQLNKETLHEKDSNFDLSVIKVQFDQFIHSKVLEPSNYNLYDLETRQDFKAYTNMEAQTFKETIIQNMDSIEQCIAERACHEQELQNRLNEIKLQIQECMVQKVKASNARSGEKDYSRIISDKENGQGLENDQENQSNTSGDESSRSRNECNDKSTSGVDMDIRPSYDTEPMVEVPYTSKYNVFAVDIQHSEQPECIINTCVVEKADSNVTLDSPDMCDNEIQTGHNAVECDDERVALANLIANLKLDIDENKMIPKQLKKANTSLTQEFKECKSTLAETSRTLRESNSIRDSCLVALKNKQTEFERYKAFNDRTVDYDKLERKLNEKIGLLAQKEIDIKEGLKLKAYEISVVKEKHDELVKQSLLTKSHYEDLVKVKTKLITDLKLKEEKDIDKMISMEKQLTFLNEIVYKRIPHHCTRTSFQMGETLYEYYWRFSHLINDMHTIRDDNATSSSQYQVFECSSIRMEQVCDEWLVLTKPEDSYKDRDGDTSFQLNEIIEVQTVFNQMEAAVDQCSVDKNVFEIQIKQLSIDNDQLVKQIMSQEIVHIVVNSVDSFDVKKSCVNECNKCLELQTGLLKKKDLIEKDVYDKLLKSYSALEKHCISLELTTQLNQESQEKDMVIRKLKDRIKSLSGKDSLENVKKDIDEIETINIELEHILKPNATIAPGMFKLDIEPISPRLKNNRDAHEIYIEKTIEHSDTLRGFELLVYVSQTFHNSAKPSEKLVAVTPMNKDKRVRFAKPITSSSNIPKQTDSLKTKDSNKPLLTSTGVKPTTSASGPKPSGNTKNNRITRTPSSNQKNKVEDHSRKVKSSLNKMNSVFEPVSNALVKHSVRNDKFESICAICNKCLFDANHDMRIIDYVNDVNMRSKSKSKRNKMRKVWKPTGKVFSEIGYSWKPTGSSIDHGFIEDTCMRTRSQARNRNRRQQQLTTVIVEEPEFPMADNRTMAQMLQAPIEGYEDAIVVPPINANNFELKQPLINLVQSNKFTGRQDPHNHLRFFNKVTSTFRHPEVPNTSIKLLLFPFSLDGEARDWLDKEPPRSILTWDDLVSKFINQFFPPSKTTYLRNKITTFYQEPNETFNEAWERFKELLRQCPHHGFSELHQLDTFYNSLNTNDQDALDSAAGGNFLDKMPREGLAIIESKSKVRYSRSRPNDSRAITNAPSSTSSPSNNSFEIQQMAALLEDKMNIRMSRLEKAISEKNATTPATVKAVEEVCVTCGSNHNFNNCPLTRNDFPVFHDNIHQFQQTAAVGNFVQRNPPNLANQMRPPGFNQPNVQNNQGNQSRYQGNNFNSNQNRGNNFNHQNNQGQVFQPPTNQPPVYQIPPYQAPTSQIQGVSKTDFENYVKANDAVLKNVQNQGQNLQNQMANVTSLLTNLCNNFKDSASTSNSGTLPSQTVTNPRQQINAITTRSGKTLEEPSTPLVPTPVVSNPQKEPEQNPETSTEKVQNPNLENTTQVPPPEEEDSIFIEIPKPKAKKTVNVEIQDLNSPRPNSYQSKLPYPERMKVRENDKPSAQHSRFLKMFKQLRLEIGLKDALVEMPKFKQIVRSVAKEQREARRNRHYDRECRMFRHHHEQSSREARRSGKISYPIFDSYSNDTRASIVSITHPMAYRDVEEDDLVYYADKSEKNKNKHFVHAISVIDFSKDDPFSGHTTIHSDDPSPSSSLVKTSDNFEKFVDELAPLDSINPLFNEMEEDVKIKNSKVFDEPVLLNTPLTDKVKCFAPEDDNDEIDDFLAMEVSSNFEEGYFDSEGDITFLDNLLSDDDSHNLASEVISEHEQEQNESSIIFSPRNDPLRHEFAVIESLPVSPIPVKDSEPAQEEIDIFLVPDDLIPPGVENDDSEDEDHELPNLDHQDDPSIPRPPPEPPDVEKCFEPEAGILITKVFKGVSKFHDLMTNILPTLPTLIFDLTFILFLSSFLSFGSEDTIFDPGIFI
ncbi:reverse transcriptase domain-containing protein [Tanacetum coccineum]